MATISGIGAILIRIILAIQRENTSYKHLFLVGLALGVVSYGGMYFVSSFWLLSLCSLTVGISYGILGTQAYIAANDIVEKDDTVGAVAWINLTHGVGYITSGFVSGKFYFWQSAFRGVTSGQGWKSFPQNFHFGRSKTN